MPAQFFRPSADVSNTGGWSPLGFIYAQINEPVPDDNTKAIVADPVQQTFVVALDAINFIRHGTSRCRLTVRANATGGSAWLSMLLLKNNTPVAGKAVLLGDTFTDYLLELNNAALIRALGDFSGLSLQVTADQGVAVSGCCSGTLPSLLFCTITNLIIPFENTCPCLSSTWIALSLLPQSQWQNGQPTWSGSGDFGSCGSTITLTFWCGDSSCQSPSCFKLRMLYGGTCSDDETHNADATSTCSPLNVIFRQTGVADECCPNGGGAPILFTVTTS